MIAIYICTPILLLITFLIIRKVRINKNKHAEWLLEINQWEIDDTVEIEYDPYNSYYCVDRNREHTAQQFAQYAENEYKVKFPNNKPEPFVKLVKWNETDALVRIANGDQIHISTKFICRNITYIERTLDKGMDTFILSKKEKLQQLRRQKLIRVLKDNQ